MTFVKGTLHQQEYVSAPCAVVAHPLAESQWRPSEKGLIKSEVIESFLDIWISALRNVDFKDLLSRLHCFTSTTKIAPLIETQILKQKNLCNLLKAVKSSPACKSSWYNQAARLRWAWPKHSNLLAVHLLQQEKVQKLSVKWVEKIILESNLQGKGRGLITWLNKKNSWEGKNAKWLHYS